MLRRLEFAFPDRHSDDTHTESKENTSPSSHHPDGDRLLQLPGRSIDDITPGLNPLSAQSWSVKNVNLEKKTKTKTD